MDSVRSTWHNNLESGKYTQKEFCASSPETVKLLSHAQRFVAGEPTVTTSWQVSVGLLHICEQTNKQTNK